jgi:BTB/POZ domain-containing protein 3/6
VDRRIFIVGFGLYGSSTGATTYGCHIELKRQGRVLAENQTEFYSDGSSNTFHVYFQQPVQVRDYPIKNPIQGGITLQKEIFKK